MKSGMTLVGASDGFRDEVLLHKKLDKYLPGVRGGDVILLNDVSGVLGRHFDEGVIDSISPFMNLREKRRLISQVSNFIYFWDGATISDFVHMSVVSGKPVKTVFVKTTRIVNKDRGSEYDVYIGRGTPWGNPFAIGENGMDRRQVIAAYRDFFRKKFIEDPQGNRDIKTLRGLVLGCHCKPEACHGDIICEYLNSLGEDEG